MIIYKPYAVSLDQVDYNRNKGLETLLAHLVDEQDPAKFMMI